MSPDGFFRNFIFCVFELPLLRKAQKRDKKNKGGNKIKKLLKKKRASNCFVFSAAGNVRHFRHCFFAAPGAPCLQGALKKKSDGPLRGWLVPRRPKKYQG
jgi:hypothetical protein